MFKIDGLREECGIIGIYHNNDKTSKAAARAYAGLMALQHRGQEACGIAVNLDKEIQYHKREGLVGEVFDEYTLDLLKGNMAVGHVRYSTCGTKNGAIDSSINAQPLVLNYLKGQLAISHNGNITNLDELRAEYEENGAIYQTSSDTEIIAQTIARKRRKAGSIQQAVVEAMKVLKGAYSMIIMSPDKITVARDPYGFRPLCMGKREDDGAIVFASETCALDALGAKFIREIEPGEVLYIKNGEEPKTHHILNTVGKNERTLCVFEHIYFARPDSIISGQFVNEARRLTGELLAKKEQFLKPSDDTIVIGVPDSGIPSALGYAFASGIKYQEGFGKNRYAGRTFIKPDQMSREAAVRLKLNPMREYISGKKVVIIDDSIVRGTTMKIIVKLLRDAGAAEVHVRISSPPFLHPCYFGTDVSNREQLISHGSTIEEVKVKINADSLAFLELEDLEKIGPNSNIGFCYACFTGKHPVLES